MRTTKHKSSRLHQLVRFGHRSVRVVFIEDYDIDVRHRLVQGADVWLNNPRRPYEACGTSGQKTALNGGLNLSTRDGWWAEAWDNIDGDIGFAIGGTSTDASDDVLDKGD